MDIQAILFDINGTLVDIETDEGLDDIYRAIGHFLTYQGISIRRGEVRDLYFQVMREQRATSEERYPEFDAVAIWREIVRRKSTSYTRGLAPEKLEQMPLFLAELYRGISRRRLQLYPNVLGVLNQLRQRYPLAVVSDAQSAYAAAELQTVGLLDYFKPVIISGDYGYRKPDQRLFEKALEGVGVQASQALYIGNDMYRDVFGAQQLGMKVVFFSSNQGEKQYPGVEPDYIIYQFVELLQAVEFFKGQ